MIYFASCKWMHSCNKLNGISKDTFSIFQHKPVVPYYPCNSTHSLNIIYSHKPQNLQASANFNYKSFLYIEYISVSCYLGYLFMETVNTRWRVQLVTWYENLTCSIALAGGFGCRTSRNVEICCIFLVFTTPYDNQGE